VTRYVFWNELHEKADPSFLLLRFQDEDTMGDEEDAEVYQLDEIESVVANASNVDYVILPSKSLDRQKYNVVGAYRYEPGKTHRVTFVNLQSRLLSSTDAFPVRTTTKVSTSLTTGEIFSGAGGSSCGFVRSGFTPIFGVEKNKDAAATFLVSHLAILPVVSVTYAPSA
jgi:hypothetical protein